MVDWRGARDRAATWLEQWDASGIHRTATAGDAAGAQWLAGAAEAMGAVPTIETFAVERLDPIASHLEFDGMRIDGVPVFDAPATTAAGISGKLGMLGSRSTIGVSIASPQTVYSGEYEALRRTAEHDALVLVCDGARPGLALLNAERFRTPYGAPAIQVPSEAHEAIRAGVERGVEARLVTAARRLRAPAENVVVTIPGHAPRQTPIVVMTPRSSWWQSTAERGGGLVCWLETLRALLAMPPAPDVVLTANTGHELGHLGLDDFLARRLGWERPVAAGGALWVHYGANLGAAQGELSLLSADPELAALAAEALGHAGHPPVRMAPPSQVPSGETRDIHRAGGRYLTLVGSNPWFHHPDDRWPHSVEVSAVARIAAAAAATVLRLTR